MGGGELSEKAYREAAVDREYNTKSTKSLLNTVMDTRNSSRSFNTKARTYNTQVPEKMLNVGVRESRDTEEHPNTTPIIIAVDVTGSMYRILGDILRVHLPQIIRDVLDANVPDPQLLFAAFGDQYTDDYPFQMNQFESDTEKILNSIQSMYPEQGGGGNGGESPALIWLAAGYHTELDSWFKRGKKGILFTISDENCHPDLEEEVLRRIFHYEKGVGDKTAKEALAKAQEQYEIYHIHMDDGNYRWSSVRKCWTGLLGERALHCKSTELSKVMIPIILRHSQQASSEVPGEAPSETSMERVEAPYTGAESGPASDGGFFF